MIKIHLLSFYRKPKTRLIIPAEEQKPPSQWGKKHSTTEKLNKSCPKIELGMMP